MNETINVSYIEDHKVIREGVNFLLSQYPSLHMVEEEFDFAKAGDFISRHKIHIFILDLQLNIVKNKKVLNGFEICEALRQSHPGVKIIAHSMYDDVENVNKIFRKGANGFVSKKSGHNELLQAIQVVSEGKRFLCSELIGKVKNVVRFLQEKDEILKGSKEIFSKAERSVLKKVARGYSTKQIAQQLGISEKTVETRRKHLFDKAKVKNVAELIAYTYSRNMFID